MGQAKLSNWVFLRGLTRDSRHWMDFISVFKSKNPDAEIMCLDFPGVGKYHDLNCTTDISDYTDFVRTEWLNLKSNFQTQNWNILGMSLGGMVALDWTYRYPKDFIKQVVINTSSSNLSAVFERVQPSGLFMLPQIVLTQDPYLREVKILSLVSNLKHKDRSIAEAFGKFAKDLPVSKKTFTLQLLAASRFKVSRPIIVPTVFLISEKDRMVSSRCSKKIAKYLNAETFVHPEAGHDLPLDDPSWTANQIMKWMSF